jgi:transposase-like protein
VTMTTARATRVMTLELSCLSCGHSCADVRVPLRRRPDDRDLRAAYAEADGPRPDWDAHGRPRCPRCRARLFIERSEGQRIYAAVAPHRYSR